MCASMCVRVGNQVQLEGRSSSSSTGLLPRFTTELHQRGQLTHEHLQAVQAAPDVDPCVVNALLQPLEGRRLNYHAFARDTPKGKNCDCTMMVARASLVRLPGQSSSQAPGWPCLAVELVADRFLRRMVRVLVGTLVREAAAIQQSQQVSQACCNHMLQLVEGMDRSATAGPAPALGLCFAAAGCSDDGGVVT